MKSFNEMRTQIDEVLSKSDDMSKWISDFLDSDAPQFKGKSKEKKMQMAKAAYYAAQKEGVMQPNGTDKVGRLKEMKCWDGYKKQGTKIGRSGKVVNNCVKKEDIELDESTEALKKKAEKSGVSLSVLKKVYARGVAAWNSGHRPGTTPQQWGMARVNSYITKGKGTYHGADKDLRESKTIKVDHTAIMDQKNASYILVQDRKCVAKGTKEDMLKLHEETPNSRVWVSTANVDDLVEEKTHPYHKGLSKSTAAKREAHWKKKEKLSDKNPKAYEPAPGDKTAETKPSKHTKKYKELYGEMKKMNEYEVKHLDSYKDGQQAAKDGKKYSDNPHPKNSKAHLNWSKGHNTQRANKMNEADIPLSDKEKNKMLSNKDKSTLGKIHSLMNKQKKEGYKSDAQRKAVWASRNEQANPEAAAKEAKKAQMAAKHASEKESLAKKHEREKESMKESSASKLVQTKLGNMDRKNVRIPSPAERKAEMEKRKQMKEDIDMLSFEEYLEEDMRIAKASSFAKKHAGDMKTAVKKIEGIRKGLTSHPKVKDALKKANEELSDKQKKLDHNKNGKIDGEDLAKIRAKKEVNELSKGTLKSYADKAHQDSLNKAYDAAHTGDRKESDKLHKQAAKRADNVKKADMKASMKKEETELDEGLLDKIANKVTNHTMNKLAKNPKKMAQFQKAQKAGVFNMKKEEEELDELSKKTLGSYVKKASFNAAQSAYQAGGSNGNIAKLQPHMDKLNKRTAGVNKATDKLTKEDVDVEIETLKSYKDFINEMQGGRYVHKGTRYGGSAQVDHDHEKDFGIDNEKEKFKRLLQKKKPEQKPAQSSTVKKGRGRPMGSKSGARN